MLKFLMRIGLGLLILLALAVVVSIPSWIIILIWGWDSEPVFWTAMFWVFTIALGVLIASAYKIGEGLL